MKKGRVELLKKSQVVTDSMNILHFFKKTSQDKSIQNNSVVASKEIINLVTNNESSSEETNQDLQKHGSKRKLQLNNDDNNLAGPNKKQCNIRNNEASTDFLYNNQPSTSEYVIGNITPSKNSTQVIFIKSPQQLLTPEALKKLCTPEKAERLKKVKKSTTPRALFTEEQKDRTPKKIIPQFRKMSPGCSSSSKTMNKKTPTPKKCKEQGEKTPKKTPKKLFDKSPNNVNEFNVQVIDNFVKITPSKSMKKVVSHQIANVNEKKQSSILKYISPSQSERSAAAQNRNEITPSKESSSKHVSVDPLLKARTKLDFSEFKSKQSISSDSNLQTTGSTKKCSSNQENDPNMSNIDYAFDDSWDAPAQLNYELDFTRSQHCKLLEINKFPTKIIVLVESTKSNERGACSIMGFWMWTNLHVNDNVHIQAEKSSENEWIVNNDYGLLVYEPDLLVSTTSIVSGVFCKRKSILTERFRGFTSSNKFMIVGTLVHSLFQNALKSQLTNQSDVEKMARNLLKSGSTVRSMYETGVTLDEIEPEIMNFVPKIVDFINNYVLNDSHNSLVPKKIKDNWQGTIHAIDDIEESVWCPSLGIKGKIDISVKSNSRTIPLELKTGRATVSLEHRGQVIMYIMMMNKLGIDVPSGLLLYLREGVLREIPMTHNEKRDIMVLRNELTYYLTRKPSILNESGTSMLLPPEIPEPINHPACEKCEYNIICSTYIKYNYEDVSSKKYLKKVQENVLSHLNEDHLKYFMHWNSLIALEANSQTDRKDVRTIYTLSPEEREMKGTCLRSLKVISVGEESNGVYEHVFNKLDTNSKYAGNFLASGILKSNYVVVSTDTRVAVAAGFVSCIDTNSINVTIDRNLMNKYSMKTFHIDTYDSNSIQSFNLASLTLLLESSTRGEELRKIIIEKKLPHFDAKLPRIIANKGKTILSRLNKVQQRAVLKGLAAKNYLLIKGMPGTGKTETIVALIQLIVALGKTVLITSHTHSAVDNVCLRLITYGVHFMRLGSENRMHPSLQPYSEHTLTRNCTSPEQLEKMYNCPRVLAVTCLGSGHAVLTKRTLDVCIVDESTQVLQSSVIRPLYAAKTFILIGDPDQLPAVVKSKEAITLGMRESLFERLNTPEATIALNLNYRMNTVITKVANILTYNGELLVANDVVGNAKLTLPNKQILITAYERESWILNTLDDSLENSVSFLDTGPVWNLDYKVPWLLQNTNVSNIKSDNQHCINFYEAAIVHQLVKALLKGGLTCDKIGVIATYRAQVAQISSILLPDKVDVSTVDQFQGKDKNVIIYSCTKSKDVSIGRDNKFDLLEDKKRLTVAITRAKNKLILIGDVASLHQYSTFAKLLPSIEKNILKLEENKDGFNWNNILNIKSSSD